MNFSDISNKKTTINKESEAAVEDSEIVIADHFHIDEGEAALVFRKDGSRELVIQAVDEEIEVPGSTIRAFSILDLMDNDEEFVAIIDDNVEDLFGEGLECDEEQ